MIVTWRALNDGENRSVFAVGVLLLVFATVTFCSHAMVGLRLYEFTDEVEQFVAANMLRHGRVLYRTVFSHHGPLPYVVAYLYAALIDGADFSYIRMFQVALVAASCASLTFCPVIVTITARLWASAMYLLLLTTIWLLQGLNTFTYYTMSGFLFSVIAAQVVIPPMLGVQPKRWGLFFSGMSAALLCLAAYSNGPALIVLIGSSLIVIFRLGGQRKVILHCVTLFLGGFSILLPVLLWMYKHADLRGYLIYHFYFNQNVYGPFIKFSPVDCLKNFHISILPTNIIHTFSLLLLLIWVYRFAVLQRKLSLPLSMASKSISLALVAVGVVLSNPRGYTFYVDSAFVTLNLFLFSLSSALVIDTGREGRSFSPLRSAFLSVAVLGMSQYVGDHAQSIFGATSENIDTYMGTMAPSTEPIYRFVRTVTKGDGDLLALNYNANIYFKADRLPASGNLFYLPWQAAYNRAPVGGYKIDLCGEIRTRRPAIIWLLNQRVEGYSLDEYEPCVLSVMDGNYTPLTTGSPWYIRRDLIGRARAVLPFDADTRLDVTQVALGPERLTTAIVGNSGPLGAFAPIKVMMSPRYVQHRDGLARIGIMFGTHGRALAGVAELRLTGPDGETALRRFELSGVADGEYKYFDLDSKRYDAGEIVSVAGEGEGLTTWESYAYEPSTCVIYVYTDGARGYTPTCPVM